MYYIANLIFYTNFVKDLIFCLLFNLFHLTVKFAINLIFSHAFGLIFCSLNNYIIFNKEDNMNNRKQTKNIWFFIKNVEKKKVTSNLIFFARLLVSTWLQIQQKRLKRLNFLRHCLQLYNFFLILSSCYKQRMSEKREKLFLRILFWGKEETAGKYLWMQYYCRWPDCQPANNLTSHPSIHSVFCSSIYLFIVF